MEQTRGPDAMRVHTCDDCDTGSTLGVGGGVFMTVVVASGVCERGQASQGASQSVMSDTGGRRWRSTPEAAATRQ